MVEPNQTKGKKNKNRTLPGTTAAAADESKSQASDATAAATQQHSDADEDQTIEEVKGQKPASIADPRTTNMAIPNPDIDDLRELFEETQKAWNLKRAEKQLLEKALETDTFKKTATLIITQLRQKKEYEKAALIEDHISLFEPHRFWDEQPVPKVTDAIKLNDDDYDKAIETKTVDQIQETPYKLPANYNWCNLDLNDDDVM